MIGKREGRKMREGGESSRTGRREESRKERKQDKAREESRRGERREEKEKTRQQKRIKGKRKFGRGGGRVSKIYLEVISYE